MPRLRVGLIFITIALATFKIYESSRLPEDNFLTRSRPHQTIVDENQVPQSTEVYFDDNCDSVSTRGINKKFSRIDGGSESKCATTWPFFATIIKFDGPICGAVIFTDRIIGTTKSCFYRSQTNAFILSNSTSRSVGDKNVIVVKAILSCASSGYSMLPSINGAYKSFRDFLMVKTDRPLLNIDNTINKPILVKKRASEMILNKNNSCYLITHSSDGGKLRVMSAEVVLEDCWNQNESQFCFAGKNKTVSTCDNDSGSPIVCYDKEKNSYALVGLVSSVIPHCDPLMGNRGIHNTATNFSYMHDVLNGYNQCIKLFA